MKGAAALRRHIEPRLDGRRHRAALDGGVRALGDDDAGRRPVDGAVGQCAAAAVVAEPGPGRRLAYPAVVELCGRAVAHRHGRVADLRYVAVHDVGARAAVEDEQRVGHVAHPAGVEDGGRAVADPDRRIVARTLVDLTLVGVHPRARVPHGQPVAAEPAHRGARQREHRTRAQVDRVLRDVVDVAVGEREHRVRVERDAVRGGPVHLAVREMPGGARGHLYAAALDLVHLAADGLQRGALARQRQPGPRGVVDAAALQARMTAAAHRDPGLPGGHHLALLEDAARAVQHADADAARVVDGAAAHRGPGSAAHLDAHRRAGRHPKAGQLRCAVLDEQRGHGRVLPLDVEVVQCRGAPYGQRHALGGRDPHRAARALAAAQGDGPDHDEVLPVRAGGDGQHVPVGRGLQGGGEGGVLSRTPPPPRCAGVRHLDRALCHGAVVPPPRGYVHRVRTCTGGTTVACAGDGS